jgi:hypothetical protein
MQFERKERESHWDTVLDIVLALLALFLICLGIKYVWFDGF